MEALNLNSRVVQLQYPHPSYKSSLTLKERTQRVLIPKLNEINEEYGLEEYSNWQENILSTHHDSSTPVLSRSPPIEQQFVTSDINQIDIFEEPNHYMKEVQLLPETTQHIIDLRSLRDTLGPDCGNFDCSPFRHVYNYESRFDQDSALNSTILSYIDDIPFVFEQELEYQELSKVISKWDALMFYLFGRDKYRFFELSKKREQFHSLPCKAMTKPLVFPGYEEDEPSDSSLNNSNSAEIIECVDLEYSSLNDLV